MGIHGPIFIGALGGSGTRAIAELFYNAGVFIGNKLNHALDNRLFSLFSSPSLPIVLKDKTMIIERINLLHLLSTQKSPDLSTYCHLLKYLPGIDLKGHDCDYVKKQVIDQYCPEIQPKFWGFKNPRSHFFSKQLLKHLPYSRFVYVVRHGLDMAYSNNNRQIKKYGDVYRLKTDVLLPLPKDIFLFWVAALKNVIQIKKNYPDRVYILKFEEFVNKPHDQSIRLLDFSGIDFQSQEVDKWCRHVIVPKSINRYKHQDLRWVDNNMINLLETAGYKI